LRVYLADNICNIDIFSHHFNEVGLMITTNLTSVPIHEYLLRFPLYQPIAKYSFTNFPTRSIAKLLYCLILFFFLSVAYTSTDFDEYGSIPFPLH